MRDFRELRIWKDGIDRVVDVYELTKQFPKEEEYGLKSQIKRAAVSVPSNIAEGCSRVSQREFRHFLEISLGSSFEVETDIVVAQRLAFISHLEETRLTHSFHSLQRGINALISNIKV